MPRPTANDIRERPAYSIGEAARYLRVNPMTLQTWALGRTYPTTAGPRSWKPLFEIADKEARRLSFINLVEAHVLTAIRQQHRIAIPKIRAALRFVHDRLNVSRPLCDEQFETNGLDLFVQRYGSLINASRSGQLTLQGQIRAALKRVEREQPSGIPIRLYPVGPREQNSSRYVVFDPTVAFGRPALVNSGAPVAVINDRFRAGDSIEELASDYHVQREAIEEAIRQAELLRAA